MQSSSIEAERIFEIGTFHGYTTLQIGLDAPVDSEIFTLDLSPESDSTSLSMVDIDRGVIEDRFSACCFDGHPVENKITPKINNHFQQIWSKARDASFSPIGYFF